MSDPDYSNLFVGKVHILDAQSQAFAQSQSGTIQEAGHQPRGGSQVREHGVHFITSKDCRQTNGPLGARYILKPREFNVQHMPVKKEQSC